MLFRRAPALKVNKLLLKHKTVFLHEVFCMKCIFILLRNVTLLHLVGSGLL
jgi:hypothetical protein